MQSRRQAIEQGKAELTRLSQQLQECDYDLSLRDLVVSREDAKPGLGLPVEPRPGSSPLDLKKPAPVLSSVEQQNRKKSTSKSHQVPPRKSSSKQLPQHQRLVVVRPILPVFSGTIDRCSRCSSHVIFFKTKCLVCSRVICNSCIKTGRCKCGSNLPAAGEKRDRSSTSLSCWPFSVGKHPHQEETHQARTR